MTSGAKVRKHREREREIERVLASRCEIFWWISNEMLRNITHNSWLAGLAR